MSLIKISKEEYCNIGLNIIKKNKFYLTLHFLLKCHFIKQDDFNIINYIKDVIKSEDDFKVFMIYRDYSMYVYKEYFTDDEDIEHMLYSIIGYVYKTYSENHDVLKPFITQVTENKDKVLEQYDIFKNSFVIKSEEIENINTALVYLEKARYLDNEAKRYNNMAIEILQIISKKEKKNKVLK
jgi:hypothetical protein